LAAFAATFAPAPGASAAKPEVLVSDFGVVASVKLTKPLARAAASSPVGAGLGIGIGHRDRSFSGLVLRGTSNVKASVRGRLGNAVAFSAARKAWFFAEDPKAASIERVAVGGFGLNGKAAGARASFIWSGQTLLSKLFSGEGFGHEGLFAFVPAVLRLATPPQLTDAQRCGELEHQIMLGEEALRDAPSRNDAALKNWMAKAGAQLERRCSPASRAGGGGKDRTGQDGAKPPDEGNPGPPANQAPSVTQQESNGFIGKTGVEKHFQADTADPDGQVVSWSWDWGDGSSTAGTGADPTSSHAFAKPRIYEVRLTVTDNEGASTTDAIQVPIGEGGSNSSTNLLKIICPGPGEETPAQFSLSVRIPSYAELPTTEVLPSAVAAPETQLCPSSGQIISTERMKGNTLGVTDEWGYPQDTVEIHVSLYWTGPGAGKELIYPVATVTWE
jgi:hypothetical protein